METIVVAVGRNALAPHDERGTHAEQKAHAGQLASVVRSLLRGGYRVLATHGNAGGRFPPGSMGSKITAAVRFLRGGGLFATVTSPEQGAGALGGTKIVLRHGDGTEKAA